MSCGPETAARYLGGALRPRPRRAYERHLLVCETCWSEVSLGRAGRGLAERSRAVAPPELRERLRTAVAESRPASEPAVVDAGSARRPGLLSGRKRRPALAVVVAAVLLVGGATVAVHVGAPDPLDAAVADFRAERLPGDRLPATAAPDLEQMGLSAIGAAAGVVDGRSVTAYAYRDLAGARVLVYRSDEPFPTSDRARLLAGPDGPWVADRDGVTVLCASEPHALLVLGDQEQLVMSAARALKVV